MPRRRGASQGRSPRIHVVDLPGSRPIVPGEAPRRRGAARIGGLRLSGQRRIADRLDAFASLLELADANPYTVRAYRRAADTIRATPRCRSPTLVRAGRVRELRGIGPGIEARLRELVETGDIAELAELERELAPGLVGLGRYLGLGARRSVEIARALGVRTPEELRAAAAAGRLRERPRDRRQDRGAAARGARARGRAAAARAASLLNRARELVGGIAAALGRRAAPATCGAGATRASGSRSSCAAADPGPAAGALRRAAADRRGDRAGRAPRRRRDGRGRAGRAGRRRAASASGPRCCARPARRPTSRRSSRSPTAPTSTRSTRALGVPVVPAGAARGAVPRRAAARCVEIADIRGDLHCHTTWSDGRASVEEMGRAASDRGYEYLAICDHTPAVGAVRGLTADDVRRQGEEIAAANEALAPFRVLRGIECDILPDGRLDLPDDVLAELDWVQASVHGGQRMPRRGDDRSAWRRRCATPHVQLPQPPHRPADRPPPGERARPRARLRARARARRRARGQRPPAPARPQRRARARRAARGRADRLLHRRALDRAGSATWTLVGRTPRAAAGPRPPTSSTPARSARSSPAGAPDSVRRGARGPRSR